MSGNSNIGKISCSIRDSIKSLSKSIKPKELERYNSPDDSIITKPELRATITGTTNDIWDVARLPANVDRISRPSNRLHKLLTENKTNHNKAIEKMNENLQLVNFDFEESYRTNAELLKMFLHKEKDKVEEIVKETLLEPKYTIVFGAIKYSDVSSAICNYGKCCTDAVEKFYNSVLVLENQRCESYKNTFKSAYSEVSQISHVMPFQIQEYFEMEIMKFNEILLQNYRCYAELDMILKTDLEQNKMIWYQKFQRNKAKWIEFFKSYGFDTSMLQQTSELDIETMVSFISVTIQDRHKQILATVIELDELVNEALRKCKFALLKIYYGEYNELHTLDDNFLAPTNATSRDQLMQYKNELKDIMHKFAAEHLLENELDDENFKTIIEELKERVKLTEVFFVRVSHLWDPHYRRAAELNDIVTKDIERIVEQHDVIIQGVEIQLSIYNDCCRSAATVDDIQKNFGYTVAALKKCAAMYSDQKDQQQQVLTNYMTMVDTEADILVAEINRFLIVYQPVYDCQEFTRTKQSVEDIYKNEDIFKDTNMIEGGESTNCSSALNDGGSGSTENKPPHIKYIDFKITSLDNWKYGIWETIEAKMRECKASMLETAREWTEPYKRAIDSRYKQKLDMNKIKFYRIWLTVYYMRFIELKRHADILERHTNGINNVVQELSVCQNKISQDISLLTDDSVKSLHNLEEQVKSAKSLSYLQTATTKMKVISDNFQNQMDKLIETFKTERFKHESKVQHSNLNYLKNILMFSESGNFHVDEVKLLTQQIQKMEKEFLKKTERSQKDFLVQIPKISQKVHSAEGSLKSLSNHMKDEFAFLDNINNCMNTLQNDIKKIAYHLKYKRKIVEAHMEKINELAVNLKGNCTKEIIEFFVAKCNEAFRNFNEWYWILNRNEEHAILPEVRTSVYSAKISKSKSVDRDGNNTENVSNQHRSVSAKNSIKSTLTICRKPIELAKHSRLEIKQPFNDAIVHLLIEKLEQMRSIGQSFYTTVRSIINKDKIEVSLEEFSGNLMAKCGYFQMQCDAMWLEEAIEYTKLSAILRKGLFNIYNNFLTRCLEYHQAKYENIFFNLQEMLNNIDANATLDIKKVHMRLKTLHGFPKNRELLEKLHEEFSKQLQIYDGRIYESIGNFKEEHVDIKEFIIDKLSNLAEAFQNLLLSDEMKDINRDIFVQILNLFTKLQLLKNKKKNMAVPSIEDKEMITAKIASERFSVYTSSLTVLPIPDEFITRFSVSSNASNSTESLSDSFEFDDGTIEFVDLAAYSKNMDSILDNHLEAIANYEKKVFGDCEKWESIWKNDVEIIKNLYTVKYNISNDLSLQPTSK